LKPLSLLNRLKRKLRRRQDGIFVTNEGMELICERYPEYQIGRGSYGDLALLWRNTTSVLTMGNYCSVAKGVQVMLGGEHRPDWVTTFPFTKVSDEFREWPGHPHSKGSVKIGNDVWICHEAMILSGVTIGDGAVIGARAVVARDVPPYAVVGGNPARVTRMRFPEDVVVRLLAVKWWDWPEARIAKALPLLLGPDIGRFLDAAESGDL
jgi:chloramphenicol O-acetyltransferase type B